MGALRGITQLLIDANAPQIKQLQGIINTFKVSASNANLPKTYTWLHVINKLIETTPVESNVLEAMTSKLEAMNDSIKKVDKKQSIQDEEYLKQLQAFPLQSALMNYVLQVERQRLMGPFLGGDLTKQLIKNVLTQLKSEEFIIAFKKKIEEDPGYRNNLLLQYSDVIEQSEKEALLRQEQENKPLVHDKTPEQVARKAQKKAAVVEQPLKANPLSLNRLHHYVFKDITELKEKDKRMTDAQIRLDLKPITQDPQIALTFRSLLREKNPTLEVILYGDKTTPLPKDNFPSEEQIEKQFEELNKKYLYFKGDDAKKKFITLFKGAKLVADFVEQNNSEDNKVAYLHAYKMLLLFGYNDNKQYNNPFLDFENYLKQHTTPERFRKPIHDTLVHDLAINENSIITFKDFKKWREIIKKSGYDAIKLFAMAPSIQEILKKAPESYKEAELAAATREYRRAKENLQLAQLCLQYNIDEEIFNQCLTIKAKASDLLPSISIDGKAFNHVGYHLVKLPPDDPRAYILGMITNCCQSIGGHSAQCVIDGITREKNGFYVLLRAKKGDQNKPILKDNQGKECVNYDDYDIVGQGYAWLSRLNNLTFDSWENLRPEIDNPVIVDLLKAFTKEVTMEPTSQILRVTIGRGGNTPRAFNSMPKLNNPERIAEGEQYGDSKEQVLIAINEIKAEELETRLKHHFTPNVLEIHSIKQAEWLELLVKSKEQYVEQFKNYNQLLEDVAKDSLKLEACIALHAAKQLTFANYQWLGRSENIAHALATLHLVDPKLISDKNFKFLVQNERHADAIANALSLLYQVDPKLITDDNRKLLTQSAANAHIIADALAILYKADLKLITDDENRKFLANADVARALSTLYQADPKLITDENRKLLSQKAAYAQNIAGALSILYQADPKLITDEIFKFLALYAADAKYIAHALTILYKADPKLISDDKNRKLLAQNAEYAYGIAYALSTLHKVDPKLITDENRKLLTQKVVFAHDIAEALAILYKADPKLITDENRKLLTQKALYAKNIAEALAILYKADPKLITDEDNRKLLTQNAAYAHIIAEALAILYKTDLKLITDDENRKFLANAEVARALSTVYQADPKLITDENFRFLVQYVQNAAYTPECTYPIARALSTLYQTDPKLITDENRKLLTQEALYAKNIAEALSILYQADPKLITDKNFKLLAQNAAFAIAEALTILYQADPKLMTDENFKLLAQNAKYANYIAKALTILYKADPKLISDEIFKLLAQNAAYAKNIAKALTILYKADPKLISDDENRKLLAQNAEYADAIAEALTILYKADPKLISDDENRKLLAQNAEYADAIAEALTILYQADPKLISDEIFKLLAQNAQYADAIAEALTILYQADPKLISDKIFEFLAQNAKYANYIAHALTILYQADPKLISNDENRKLLARNAEYAYAIAEALTILYQADPKLISDDENRKLLAQNAAYAKNIAEALTILYKADSKLISDKNFKLVMNHPGGELIIADQLIKQVPTTGLLTWLLQSMGMFSSHAKAESTTRENDIETNKPSSQEPFNQKPH